MVRCSVCERDIDPAGPAIVNAWGGSAHYVGFVEDLRGSPDELRHATCFLQAAGPNELLAAVRREDERRRTADLTNRPPLVWVPQATLEGQRDEVNIYDLGAFTSEATAREAMSRWIDVNPSVPELVLNLIPIYDTVDEWLSDL